MQLSLTLTGDNPGKLASDLRAAADLLDKTAVITTTVESTTPARGRKAAKPAVDTEGEEFDLGGDEPEAGETELDEPAPTLENVIACFRDYVKKHSKEKAAKVLAKYKVKSVRDLPEAKYAEVIETLEA